MLQAKIINIIIIMYSELIARIDLPNNNTLIKRSWAK